MSGADNAEKAIQQDERQRTRAKQSGGRGGKRENDDGRQRDGPNADAIHGGPDKRHHQRAGDVGRHHRGGQHAARPAELGADRLQQHAEREENDRTVADHERKRRAEHDQPAGGNLADAAEWASQAPLGLSIRPSIPSPPPAVLENIPRGSAWSGE